MGRLLASQSVQIDPQLLRFFVKMASFQSKCLRGLAHIVVAALQFGHNHFAFKRLYTLA